MRRSLVALAVFFGLGLVGSPSTAQAQFNSFADPFTFYYGYFIPSQAYQASIPKAEDTVRMYSAQRQASALTERAGLYDPVGSMGGDDLLRSFGDPSARGGSPARMTRTNPMGVVNTHVNGSGPTGYYNRVNTYHPNLRLGRGANRSIAPIGGPRRGGMGGFGMPSMTPSMGGFR